MKLRHFTFGLAAIFVVYGLGLAIVGGGVLHAHILGGVVAGVAGVALAVYGVILAVGAHRDRFPDWIRDLRQSAPL